MYMWQTVYNFNYIKKDNFVLIFGEYEGTLFAIAPLCKKEYLKEAFDHMKEIFKLYDRKIIIRAVTNSIKEYIEANYPDAFSFETNRDDYDYVYDAESLRTLAGRRMHSKKNHYNGFIKEYGERFVYKSLDSSEYDECLKLADKWAFSKEKDRNLIGENLAIKKVFKNSSKFKYLKVGGIFIDNRLEAFTFGDYLNENMAVIHIEKGNPDMRGIYSAMNKLFLVNEFPEVEFVNREDDLGIEGLRKAKLSYKPVELVEKYMAIEN